MPRNIPGAYRGKAISIASIKLSSNVSGRPLASEAARSIRVCFSRTSRAIPARELQAGPKPIEPRAIDASLGGHDLSGEQCLLWRPASLGKKQPRRDNFAAVSMSS